MAEPEGRGDPPADVLAAGVVAGAVAVVLEEQPVSARAATVSAPTSADS
ncbi:hypothetical protein [Acidipropionibacterium jensenii]|nr:hypothetical protein [Acidipropionibacterium jensenii]MDN5976414.1 hypothetical protein [Acidipropionibacterium jensenii]MDN5995155.1 hypothetical protein [Acidipropionibacterium jensenii]MDN6792410.1 hypothetical protein [Acidipropionibacterium jensenii]